MGSLIWDVFSHVKKEKGNIIIKMAAAGLLFFTRSARPRGLEKHVSMYIFRWLSNEWMIKGDAVSFFFVLGCWTFLVYTCCLIPLAPGLTRYLEGC